jgi:hypothetical protein
VDDAHPHPPRPAQPRAVRSLRRRDGRERLDAARRLPLPRAHRRARPLARARAAPARGERAAHPPRHGRRGGRTRAAARPVADRGGRVEPGRRRGLPLAVPVGLRGRRASPGGEGAHLHAGDRLRRRRAAPRRGRDGPGPRRLRHGRERRRRLVEGGRASPASRSPTAPPATRSWSPSR